MTAYIALLRAVNVGGTGKILMSDLKTLCEAAGFSKVQTYIASGNVVFTSKLAESRIKSELESKLTSLTGKPAQVLIRTAAEMAAVLEANPFREAAPNATVAIFLDQPPPAKALDEVSGQKSERIGLGVREIYVHYGEGMGKSKLKIPAASTGTARNMNTVAKLLALASKL